MRLNNKKYEWPKNLLVDISDDFMDDTYNDISSEVEENILEALKYVPSRYENYILMYYRDGKSVNAIAKEGSRSITCISEKIHKGLRKMRNPKIIKSIKTGFGVSIDDIFSEIRIDELMLDANTDHILYRHGINTISKLMDILKNDPKSILEFDNIGITKYNHIVNRVNEYTGSNFEIIKRDFLDDLLIFIDEDNMPSPEEMIRRHNLLINRCKRLKHQYEKIEREFEDYKNRIEEGS